MSTINKQIAKSLGMAIPEDDAPENPLPVVVAPHEIVVVDNPDLPVMSDIDHTLLEGEKQLEEIINMGMTVVHDLQDKMNEVEPRYRNRYIENVNASLSLTLDAIKHKTNLQMEKKKLRMEEAGYRQPTSGNKPGSGGNVTNNFVMTREQVFDMMRQQAEKDTGNS